RCRVGDEAGGPWARASRPVIRPEHEQPGERPLRAGVGLQRDLREPGDLREHVLELAEQDAVAGSLLARREGVQAVELAPRQGNHLGCEVEFHRGLAEWDYGG